MKYLYECTSCKKETNHEFQMGTAPNEITCDCGGIMKQNFLKKLKSIQTTLPEDYKALSDYHSVDYGDDSDMEKMMNFN